MTKNEAFSIGNVCSIAKESTQITLGVRRRLVKNTNFAIEIQKEIEAIKALAAEKKHSEEETKKEIEELLNQEFTHEFEKIDVNVVDDLKHEILELGDQKYSVIHHFDFLIEKGIVA